MRTSLRGFSRPATYGNVIRAFRWMLSCVFALLRNLPSLPSSFSFFLSSLLSFSRTFALSLPQRESMSMRKRFVSAFRLRESHETSKICVFTPLETDTSPSFSTRRNNHVYGYLDGSILTRL